MGKEAKNAEHEKALAVVMADKFDHTSEAMMRDPWDMLKMFRGQCPVAHSSLHGGFYFASTYDSVMKIVSDWETFSSADGVGIPPQPFTMPPIELDPPRHTDFRRILNRLFTVKEVEKRRNDIEQQIHKLIDTFIERGAADIANELIRPLMPILVLPILGVPLEDQIKVCAWIDHILFGRVTDPAGVQRAGMEVAQYLHALASSRRGGPPDETNAMGLLLLGTAEGEPISDDEIARTITLVLFGGLDTSTAVMAESLLFLARNPDEKRKLRDGKYNWAVAIEEFVRITSPLVALRRTLTKETELAGTQLKKGDRILSLYGSANRDENKFVDADKCILDRSPNPHVGFGAETHFCLGRNLARLEIEVMLKVILARMYDFQVSDDFSPEYVVGESRGMKTLPATFTPGRKKLS